MKKYINSSIKIPKIFPYYEALLSYYNDASNLMNLVLCLWLIADENFLCLIINSINKHNCLLIQLKWAIEGKPSAQYKFLFLYFVLCSDWKNTRDDSVLYCLWSSNTRWFWEKGLRRSDLYPWSQTGYDKNIDISYEMGSATLERALVPI